MSRMTQTLVVSHYKPLQLDEKKTFFRVYMKDPLQLDEQKHFSNSV